MDKVVHLTVQGPVAKVLFDLTVENASMNILFLGLDKFARKIVA